MSGTSVLTMLCCELKYTMESGRRSVGTQQEETAVLMPLTFSWLKMVAWKEDAIPGEPDRCWGH